MPPGQWASFSLPALLECGRPVGEWCESSHATVASDQVVVVAWRSFLQKEHQRGERFSVLFHYREIILSQWRPDAGKDLRLLISTSQRVAIADTASKDPRRDRTLRSWTQPP
ncbi:hypothetical protein CBM2609_U10068 [Cupriavidus taiwanensis]|nr:hypothetical protein CBM2604_U10026 [Cupriavidus taiwanensis]SOZ34472.1 hypothetical protein CBM2609_U10068 [Cupriavidus taiwanensis]